MDNLTIADLANHIGMLQLQLLSSQREIEELKKENESLKAPRDVPYMAEQIEMVD